MQPGNRPAAKGGIGRILAAGRNSAAGLRRLSREAAFRQEALAGFVVLGLMAALGASAGKMLGFVALMFLLVAVEALNTALEVLVDEMSPGWAQFAKDAKDLGSVAVALVMAAIAAYLLWAAFA
ncbi:diacylglycerol kinase [Rhodobacter sp. Har01]|uniref:diacylglycerol kinase n=1 Tax=Rhodobacter sp. Har01 TaxID=2883999 RepID=UPI001D074244|nr:diacylglycerol kinase [Rhodobacter sp. Har01]MCB6179238.1 diacylglycerol kinase [Rhodobacter sp. Har01]